MNLKPVAQLKKLAERFDQLTVRERVLVFASVLAVLLFAATNLFFSPQRQQQKQLEEQLRGKLAQIAELEQQNQEALRLYGRDRDVENRERLVELEKQLQTLGPGLSGATKSLVSPQEMARLVEQVLVKNRALEVIKVESLAAQPIAAPGDAPPADAAPAPAPGGGIYRHGMRIEVRGRYVDLVQYLRALEALPWKLFWGQVTLAAEDYPNSRLTLVIYTLGLRPGWIGT